LWYVEWTWLPPSCVGHGWPESLNSLRVRTVFRSRAARSLAAVIWRFASCINSSHLVNTLLVLFFGICVNLQNVRSYSALIIELDEELKRLALQRELIDRKVANVSKAIEAIKELAEESDEAIVNPPPLPDEAGFTERVRALLRVNAAKVLTAVEIRDYMHNLSPNDDPKVLLIHTHNTLKRLKKQKEVDDLVGSDGRIGYRWKGSTVPDSGSTVTDLIRTLQDMNPTQAIGAWAASAQEQINKARKK
jgi:hypothetical protein